MKRRMAGWSVDFLMQILTGKGTQCALALGLTQLKLLVLYDTKVTDEGVKRLRQALPNCKIER